MPNNRYACRRESSDDGNKLYKLIICFDDCGKFSDGRFLRETEKAYGVKIHVKDDKYKDEWFPKSKMSGIEIADDKISFFLPFWLIREKSVEFFIDSSDEPTLFDMFVKE